jgi:hypothetical protein
MESPRINVAETSSTTTLVTEDIPLIPKYTDDFCSRLESQKHMQQIQMFTPFQSKEQTRFHNNEMIYKFATKVLFCYSVKYIQFVL